MTSSKSSGLAAERNQEDEDLAVEADESRQAELNEFIARNRTAIDGSLEQSHRERSAGLHGRRSIADIIADGRRRHSTHT